METVEFSSYDFGCAGHASGITTDAAAGIATAVAINAAEVAVVAADVDCRYRDRCNYCCNMAAEAAVPALAVLESTNESSRNYHSGV